MPVPTDPSPRHGPETFDSVRLPDRSSDRPSQAGRSWGVIARPRARRAAHRALAPAAARWRDRPSRRQTRIASGSAAHEDQREVDAELGLRRALACALRGVARCSLVAHACLSLVDRAWLAARQGLDGFQHDPLGALHRARPSRPHRAGCARREIRVSTGCSAHDPVQRRLRVGIPGEVAAQRRGRGRRAVHLGRPAAGCGTARRTGRCRPPATARPRPHSP